MSRFLSNFKDRRVIISVLVILAAVIVLNWRIFKPIRDKQTRRSTPENDELQPPADLNEITLAYKQLRRDSITKSSMGSSNTDSELLIFRDPFRKVQAARQLNADLYNREFRKLSCSAVLLGGRRPTALINGRSCHNGEYVRGYLVERIGSKGVLLSKENKRIVLPVGKHEKGIKYYPMVTNTPSLSNKGGVRSGGRTDIQTKK